MPWIAILAEGSDVLAAQAASAKNGANMPQGFLQLDKRIDPFPTDTTGTKSLRPENEPGKQMTCDNLMGTPVGALEDCKVDEMRHRSIELMFYWPRASRARASTA